jgi:hypothetical protein
MHIAKTAPGMLSGLVAACLLPGAAGAQEGHAPDAFVAEDIVMAAPVEAPSILADLGAAERVAAATDLRMLTQRIAAAGCRTYVGEGTEDALEAMDLASIAFDDAIAMLIYGNSDMGVPEPERNAALLRHLSSVEAAWAPILAASVDLGEGVDPDAAAAVLFEGTDALMGLTTAVAAEVAAEYANPVELLGSDALLIGIAGEQATHAQRLAGLSCRAAAGVAPADADAEIALLSGYLDAALTVLLDGQPDLGIEPAPTTGIAAALAEAEAAWSPVRALLDAPDAADRARLYERLDAATEALTRVKGLYRGWSKRTM